MRAFIKNLRHEDHKKALMATLVFIMLMILFFLLVSLEYPNPPIKEKVVEVQIDFGSDFAGGGKMSDATEVVPQAQAASAAEQAVQDDSPVVVTTAKGTSKNSKNTTTSTSSTTTPTTTPKPDPKPSVDKGLGFPGGGTDGSGGGTGPGFGDGAGINGNGGTGDTGQGQGTSNTSRKLKSKGKQEGQTQEEGIIALDLYVDEFGNVVRMERNESKSTGSANLLALAKKNAKKYKYESIVGAPIQFVGTVTFNFRKD